LELVPWSWCQAQRDFGLLAANAQAGTYEHVVQGADIEKAAGLKGVKAVPRDPSKGATGMLNFADAQGALVFTATFEIITPEALAKTKASPSWKGLIKGPVSGLGDEAYMGPKGGDPFILIFKKGKIGSPFLQASIRPT
jgi:hypothetical protein